MRKYLVFCFALTGLLLWGAQASLAEPLASTYDLGDHTTLNFGAKAGGLYNSRNIAALKKSDVVSEGDALILTLTRPADDFGGDSASLGVVYTKSLQENMTSTLSLTGGPAEGSLGKQDVAVTFSIHIALQ